MKTYDQWAKEQEDTFSARDAWLACAEEHAREVERLREQIVLKEHAIEGARLLNTDLRTRLTAVEEKAREAVNHPRAHQFPMTREHVADLDALAALVKT